jgi:hypothetical protein
MTQSKGTVHVAGKTIDLPVKKGVMGAEHQHGPRALQERA